VLTRLALALAACSLIVQPALGQDAREGADRALKGALAGNELSQEEVSLAFEIVHEFLKGQARLCERREGPRNEEEIDWLVSELLAGRLAENGIPLSGQRPLLGVAFGRLTELVEMATRRDEGEGGIKRAIEGSSLTEDELAPALWDLIDDSEESGPRLLRRADEIAAEENANALPGQEVEADPLPLVVSHLKERFDGRGLTSGELEDLAVPFLALIEVRREQVDARRFAQRR
jgi:hypothetical protein